MQIILTGANRGIGAEMTAQMRARGDEVRATSRDGSTGVTLDVTDTRQIEHLGASHEGPLDLLVCNAGVYLDKGHDLSTGYDPELWAQTFAVNVTGVFLTIKALLPALEQSKAPKIAILASQMGSSERAGGNAFIYRASKAALNMVLKTLSIEFGRRFKETVIIGLHPGTVDTDLSKPFQGNVPEGKLFTPEFSSGKLLSVIDQVRPEDSGLLFAWDGEKVPF